METDSNINLIQQDYTRDNLSVLSASIGIIDHCNV